MRRQDLSPVSLLLEAITFLLTIGYLVLQIVYGIVYHRGVLMIAMNCLVMLAVYALFTMLSIYPEAVNRVSAEICKGKVRRLTLWMVRLEKFLFVGGLVIPCIFDVLGREIPNGSSLILVAAMLVLAVGFEWAIIHEYRNGNEE